jgi:LmbE family N-acetylglucosaminyl deacetylase
MGKQVTFLICTDGRYGLTHAPAGTTPEALVAIRQKEARASAAVLGVKDVRFLPLSDGGFYTDEDLCRGIAEVIGETQPQVLFAPDPCVDSECHTDHLRTGEAARRMVFAAHSEHIMAQLGGPDGELGASLRYLNQRYTMPTDEIKGLLTDIGTEECEHL